MATHSSIHAWKIPRTEKPGDYSPWGYGESDTTEVTQHISTRLGRIWLFLSIAAAKSLQSCLTLSDPMDCSLPGSIQGIFQARVLEWSAIAFSDFFFFKYQIMVIFQYQNRHYYQLRCYYFSFRLLKKIFFYFWLSQVLVEARAQLLWLARLVSSSRVCGIRVPPDQGSNPSLLHWQCFVKSFLKFL